LDDIYALLTANYVEDDDGMFRFDYSREFLFWCALLECATSPERTPRKGTHSTGLLAAIPRWSSRDNEQQARGLCGGHSGAHACPWTVSQVWLTVARSRTRREVDALEINFLCVHKRLRGKRLAPVLIKEITRRANLAGVSVAGLCRGRQPVFADVWQAVFTAGVRLPRPVATNRSVLLLPLARPASKRASVATSIAR
jgi:glycylpeptide N-tetradecanoyltransferase